MSTLPWVVLKFGGTSVATPDRWRTIASIAGQRVAEGERPLLVCSALSGVSDLLVSLADQAVQGDPSAALAELRARHESFAQKAGIDLPAGVADELRYLERLSQGVAMVGELSPRLQARMLAAGERMSTLLGAALLHTLDLPVAWLDARDLLQADDRDDLAPERRWLSARCTPGASPALQATLGALSAPVLLTQGFIAKGPGGEPVVLGRGGSDTSATLLAARLGAHRCEIWTDVPGMFTANPRTVPDARMLRRLDYAEAQEIATTGAKVLHPACILPARLAEVPIHIRCTPRPALPGTVIQAATGDSVAGVKAVSQRSGVVLVSMETLGMWQEVGFLARAAACFARHDLSLDLIATSETNVTVSLDASANLLEDDRLEAVLHDLRSFCDPRIVRDCASVSLVGRGIRSVLHRLGGVFELFEEQRVHLVSQAANDLNLTVVVDASQASRLVSQVHAVLLQDIAGTSSLGPRWSEVEDHEPASRAVVSWWGGRQRALLQEASHGTPVYVYDEATLRARARQLLGLEAVSEVLFAMKANPCPGVLAVLADEGVGFECVSPAEVERAGQQLQAAGSPRPVLFTPNFAPRSEYAQGLAAGARVTLDNLHPLEHWGDLFAGAEVFLRVDPGKGHGHHAHVRTAGSRSKFGIPPWELDRAAALAAQHGVKVVGLHAHVGSGVRDPEAWPATAERLVAAAAGRFPDVAVLDLGGGLGVPEKPGQAPLDLDRLDQALLAFRRAHPTLALWLEPGRFLVAESGVLLARVTQRKDKGATVFVGVDAGMHTLLRPALYGAWHGIHNLTRAGQTGPWEAAEVVGPICETGDVLGHDRLLIEPVEGDVLLVETAGAYGASMASNYNLRGAPREVVLTPG